MPSEKFRRQLRQEAQLWQADGLISASQFQQIADRYQFDRIDIHAKNRFTLILLGVGCVLIGLGVITFVAANWQDIPRIARVALLLSLFVGINFGGFTLWKQPGREQWQHRLGEAILLLGSLILGANMALMAQMFHISGAAYGLYITWGLGVLAMAYSLRLASLGMLAVLLIGIGYWQGWWEVSQTDDLAPLSLMVKQMPLVAVILFLPLAYWCRSKVLFALSAIAMSSALIAGLLTNAVQSSVLVSIMIVLPALLLWGYSDTLWNFWRRPVGSPFQPLARRLAVLYLGGAFYWLSFHWIWKPEFSRTWFGSIPQWHALPSVLILSVVAIAQWLYLLRFARNHSGRLQLNLNTISIFALSAIAAVVTYWDMSIHPIQVFATFIFNLMLALLAIGTLRESLDTGERRSFWFSIVLLILQILSRLLEYDTGLLLKSLIFILCGVGVIAAGLWFERYVRTLPPAIRE